MRKRKKRLNFTIVVFRRYKEGDVVALFPDIPFDPEGNIASYSHIGQHAAANYDKVLEETVAARREEYRHLKKELEKAGYTNLEVKEIPPDLRQGNLFTNGDPK